ncbi:MAG: nucleotidyl transferase AbiEii/AbiGii toxin family protein [Lentisphaerae bacterium]|nr:nucleotidyl transferase AbiEii/AbiGii toxin family protein [Lentisphaerota bacterium]
MQSTPELVAACLARAGVDALVVGGLAMEAHGYGRQTYDVDCLMAAADVDAFERSLLGEGYARAPSGENFRRYAAPSVYQAPVDVLLVAADTFGNMLKDSLAWQFGSVTLRVPSLPHVIALKLHAIRNNPAREARDLGDVSELLAANPGAIAEADLAALCAKHGPPGIGDRLGRLRS